MASTLPTISRRMPGSSIAVTGISTLCSTAMARARASMESASARTWYTAVSRPVTAMAAGTFPDVAPPPGAMVPAGGFGAVWRAPEVKSRLGWAVYEPRGSGGSIQSFERGVIVWTPHGLLYVLSDDGRWRTFPDASPL